MKQTINKSMFRDAFINMNRKENFSYEALGALYEYLEELDSDYELDVVGICCEFNEDKIENVLENYNLESIEDLEENTSVIWTDGKTVLFQAY